MKWLKKILKILGYTLLIGFVVMSILPYLLSVSEKENDFKTKPFSNSEFFTQDKTTIHYRTWVPDSVKHYVLMIHGFAGSTFSFRNNIDALIQNKCAVVAIDLPGFGFSSKDDVTNYSDTFQVQIIKKLIDTKLNLATKKWVLMGHSMGALSIANFASTYPNKVDRLIFIDGVYNLEPNNSSFVQFILKYPPIKRWSNVLVNKKTNDSKSFAEILTDAYGEKADSNAVNGYKLPLSYSNSGSAIVQFASTKKTISVNESTLKNIPKMIVWGTEDKWIPKKTADDFLKTHAGVKIVFAKGAGHCPMETYSPELNPQIIDFITPHVSIEFKLQEDR